MYTDSKFLILTILFVKWIVANQMYNTYIKIRIRNSKIANFKTCEKIVFILYTYDDHLKIHKVINFSFRRYTQNKS